MPVPTVDRARVLAWRLSAHGLDQRLPESRGTEAVRPAGLRDAVPDAASVGWHARAEGVTSGALRSALVERRWVKAPTVRGTRVLDPRDLPTLTAGALPADEPDLRDRLRRRGTAAAGPARELLEQGIAAAHAAFEAGPRTQAELSQAITAALPAGAAAWCSRLDVNLIALDGWRAVHREPVQRELAVVAGLRGADLGRVSGP